MYLVRHEKYEGNSPNTGQAEFHSMSLLSSCRELGFFDPPHQAHLKTTEGEAPLPQSFVHLRLIASGSGKSPDSPSIFMLTSLYDYARRAYPSFRLGGKWCCGVPGSSWWYLYI